MIGPAPEGLWAGQAETLANYLDGSWYFQTPHEGWIAWLSTEARLLVFNGIQWFSLTALDEAADDVPLLGINTASDEYNRLAIKSEAVLISHEDSGSGNR